MIFQVNTTVRRAAMMRTQATNSTHNNPAVQTYPVQSRTLELDFFSFCIEWVFDWTVASMCSI